MIVYLNNSQKANTVNAKKNYSTVVNSRI